MKVYKAGKPDDKIVVYCCDFWKQQTATRKVCLLRELHNFMQYACATNVLQASSALSARR